MKHQASESELPEGLADRINALEVKYETMRRAVLDWGKEVDAVKRWSDDHLKRIMALESTVGAALTQPTPNHRQIRSSLVNRVALAISGIEYGLERSEEAVNWASEARAAIREVARWIREQQDGDLIAATDLEREAERYCLGAENTTGQCITSLLGILPDEDD